MARPDAIKYVKPHPLTRSPLLLFMLGLLLALLSALSIIIPVLNPPEKDIRLLILFLASTGGLTLFTAFMLQRLRLIRWFRSLRWTLLITIVLTVLLVFLNVWVTAKLMFINPHDLTLTTALLVFAGIIALCFGLFISSTTTDNINELCVGIRRLAVGDLNTRLGILGNDELAEVARAFNSMASQLQEMDENKRLLDQTRRDLVAWVSHDLRTPLSSMRVMIEAITDGVVADQETISRYLGNTQGEIEHLSHLIDDLFDLAQLDVGHLALKFEMASLRDLISDTLGSMNIRAVHNRVRLDCEVDELVDPVYIVPDKIQRVLYNLLENAIRYTPAGEMITLRARRIDKQVQVDIHNSGANITPADLSRIFESFYRGERSRAQTDGKRGVGLGLAIARGFVEAHGGKIWVESSPAHGTTFSFTLPDARVRAPR